MKKAFFAIALLAISITAFGQEEVTEEATAVTKEVVAEPDYVAIDPDSTETRNGKIVTLYYKLTDSTPRVFEGQTMSVEQLDQSLTYWEDQAGRYKAGKEGMRKYDIDKLYKGDSTKALAIEVILLKDPSYQEIQKNLKKLRKIELFFEK